MGSRAPIKMSALRRGFIAGGVGLINLEWKPVPGATGYRVFRVHPRVKPSVYEKAESLAWKYSRLRKPVWPFLSGDTSLDPRRVPLT